MEFTGDITKGTREGHITEGAFFENENKLAFILIAVIQCKKNSDKM